MERAVSFFRSSPRASRFKTNTESTSGHTDLATEGGFLSSRKNLGNPNRAGLQVVTPGLLRSRGGQELKWLGLENRDGPPLLLHMFRSCLPRHGSWYRR